MLYLDSSAIVKLVRPEPETPELVAALKHHPERLSSVLARVEVGRAARRAGSGVLIARAERLLARMMLVPVDVEVLLRAVDLPPFELGSLDAVHLATALLHRDDLEGFVTYDRKLAAAASAAEIPILVPA
jgi:predicted nucleic acid-binding protein